MSDETERDKLPDWEAADISNNAKDEGDHISIVMCNEYQDGPADLFIEDVRGLRDWLGRWLKLRSAGDGAADRDSYLEESD